MGMLTEEKAHEHIEAIKKDYVGNWRVVRSLSGALNLVELMITRRRIFLFEFLQNAIDARARRFQVIMSGNILEISNDGLRFSHQDVDSICSIGPHKDPRKYLGYFGAGFKSIFWISQEVHIYSYPYRFKFSQADWPNPEEAPWQITPRWIEEYPTKFKEHNVTFAIHLGEKEREEVLNEMREFYPRALLFLPYIEGVTLNWDGKEKYITKHEMGEICRLGLREEGKEELTEWAVFRSGRIDVPDYIKNDKFTKEWKREKVESREVAVAFRLDQERNLIEEPLGTAQYGIFSFQPVKEERAGLPFLVQADFLTDPGRNHINREAPWNKDFLLKEIRELLKNKVIPRFQREEKWRLSYTPMLWSETEVPPFAEEIAAPLKKEIEGGTHFISLDNEFISYGEEVKVKEQEILKTLDKETIEKLTNKKILHPECKVPKKLEQRIKSFSSFRSFLSEVKDIQHWKGLGDEWKVLYGKALRGLADEFSNLSDVGREKHGIDFRQAIFIFDEKEEVGNPFEASLRRIFLPPLESEKLARETRPKEVSLLHHELREEKIIQFLESLGAKRLKYSDILKFINESGAPEEYKKLKPPISNEKEAIEAIKKLENYFEIGAHSAKEEIPVRTKSGKWIEAGKVFFGPEYGIDEELRELFEAGILEDSEFLDPIFIAGETPEGVQKWRNFFEEAGIGKRKKKELPDLLLSKLKDPLVEDEAKILIIKKFKKRWEKERFLPPAAEFLMRSKGEEGKWVKCNEVFFGREYEEDEGLKRLERLGIEVPYKLLDPSFIKEATEEEKDKWIEFFRVIGVKKVSVKELELLLENLKNPSQGDELRIKILEELKNMNIHKKVGIPWKDVLVRTTTKKWVEPENVIFSSKYGFEDSLVEELLEDEFYFLDPVFIEGKTPSENQEWKEFFEAIKVGSKKVEITGRLIEKLKDPFVNEEKKVAIIKNLKARKEKGESLPFKEILVKVKESEKWIRAQDVLFSSEYKPREDIERLIKEGLLDEKCKFLDPIFIEEEISGKEIQNWKNFFTAIGVGTQRVNIPEKLLQKLRDPYSEDQERKKIIKELKRREEEKALDLKGIPVKTKQNAWIKATEVFFSSEYQPLEDLERLVEAGVLHEEFYFLDPSFIEGNSQEVQSWVAFFSKAGVGEQLNKLPFRRMLINKASIGATLHYEQEVQHVREDEIRILPEHERGKGYDVQSKFADGSPKYIEVKGLGKEEDINLGKFQYRRALKESEHTYIYVVLDALRYPVLYTIKATSLESEEFLPSLTLNPSNWKRIAEPPWRCPL